MQWYYLDFYHNGTHIIKKCLAEKREISGLIKEVRKDIYSEIKCEKKFLFWFTIGFNIKLFFKIVWNIFRVFVKAGQYVIKNSKKQL